MLCAKVEVCCVLRWRCVKVEVCCVLRCSLPVL